MERKRLAFQAGKAVLNAIFRLIFLHGLRQGQPVRGSLSGIQTPSEVVDGLGESRLITLGGQAQGGDEDGSGGAVFIGPNGSCRARNRAEGYHRYVRLRSVLGGHEPYPLSCYVVMRQDFFGEKVGKTRALFFDVQKSFKNARTLSVDFAQPAMNQTKPIHK